MLINMDANMKGRVLTAHGAGDEWTKTCGLGQGSVLAPLKWNLFLDPLLNRLQTTRDPYILSNGLTRIELRVLAFADDTTIFASTYKGYLERMAMAGEYFSIFGVNFSPSKTHYTYANTNGRHYKSAPISVRNPDGTISTQQSSVTSPHKPLRYLGAWLSPTLNWLPAKRKLRDEVTKLLTILRLKTLSPSEFKYTVQSVIHSKLRYYLAVVPLLDSELETIDRKIAHIMKKRMHLAASCSSPLIFLPDSEYGAELPSIKDTRATMLVTTAHNLLNDNHSTIGKITRMRLAHLQDSLGWATNPLDEPSLIPLSRWNTHWCARIGTILGLRGATLSDTRGILTKHGSRSKDIPLHTLLPQKTFASARHTLQKHGLYWLGQLANPTGTKLSSKSTTGTHTNSPWWKSLQASTTDETGSVLLQPISPTISPIVRFVPTHNPGTVAVTYSHNPDSGEWEHTYYKITDSCMKEGRESCSVTQLYICTTKLRSIHRDITTRGHNRQSKRKVPVQITRTAGHPYFKGDNHTEEFANALHPVQATWARVTPYGCGPMDVALIHDSCLIQTKTATLMGSTTAQTLADAAQATRNTHCPITGDYIPQPVQEQHHCQICKYPASDLKCCTPRCTTHCHRRCITSDTWKCTACTHDHTRVQPLHQSHLSKLEERALTHTIYSASDGSVIGANTDSASSSFGLVIDHQHTNIRRRGKIKIRTGEESSLRVELEALIHAYHLIPKHIETIHAVDNETTIDIHNSLASTGLPTQRTLMKMPYHSTIVRLHNAMQERGRFLEITHTLSHLEHKMTGDIDLKHRRDALAKADTEADTGHQIQHIIQDPSGIEDFALRINGTLVEKAASSPFASIHTAVRKSQLYSRKMEGANHRAGCNPGWNTGGRKWPNFLRTFRHKLITQRLPTADNRSRRGDSENGTQVNPWCPLCLETGTCTVETHDHLLTCPCTSRDRLKLARQINNDCRHYYLPKSISTSLDYDEEGEILDNAGISWDTTDGWESHMTDKHGRKTVISKGPQGRIYNGIHRLTSWAHNILRHADTHISPQHHYGYLQDNRPDDSVDPHLLQGLAQTISATTIHDTIAHNPFIPTPTLHTSTPSVGHLPTVINTCEHNVDWSAITRNIDHTRPWILLADDTQLDDIQEHIPTKRLTIIPPDTISQWGYSFWAGKAGLFPETVGSNINVFVSDAVTPYQRTSIMDVIYMRSLTGGTLSSHPSPPVRTLTQETPLEISDLLTNPDSSAPRLQLLSGVISLQITNAWKGTIPQRLHQKLYRTLHKTIVLHQHGAWLHRNNTLHPDTEHPVVVDYGRKRATKRMTIEDEEVNNRDKEWMRQRKAGLLRERMWEGTPLSPNKTNPRRTPVTTQDSTSASSESSETDEWPSPTRATSTERNTSESDSLGTDPTSSDTQTNQTKRKLHLPPQVRKPVRPRKRRTLEASTTNTGDTGVPTRNTKRKHYLPPQVRKHARPQKRQALTSLADVSPPTHLKRKRQLSIQIRKPCRPRKQQKSPTEGPQADHPPSEDNNTTHKRRSIDQLIAYIHSTRPSSAASTRRRQRQARVGVEEGNGKRRAVRTATSAHDATGEDQPTPAHTTDTQHASLPTEGRVRRTLQWTHTTPPPSLK